MRSAILLLLSMVSVIAQDMDTGLRTQPMIVWGDSYWFGWEDYEDRLLAFDLKTGASRSIPVIRRGNISAWDNHIGNVVVENKQFVFCERDVAKEEWTRTLIEHSRIPEEGGVPFLLYGTSKPGLYFGMNIVELGFSKDGDASIASWWRKGEDGVLRLDAVIPIDADESLFGQKKIIHKESQKQSTTWATPNPRVKGMFPILEHPILVPGAFLVVSWKTGTIWAIKEGHSTPFKTIQLSRPSKEQIAGTKRFPHVLLGIQPLRNGSVLIAAREEAVIEEPTDRPNPRQIPPPPPEHPKIRWLTWDPMYDGSPREAPYDLVKDLPTTLANDEDAYNMRFGISPDGAVVFPWKPIKLTSEKAEPKSGATSKKALKPTESESKPVPAPNLNQGQASPVH
jgi:hypothetical protein